MPGCPPGMQSSDDPGLRPRVDSVLIRVVFRTNRIGRAIRAGGTFDSGPFGDRSASVEPSEIGGWGKWLSPAVAAGLA